MHEPNLDSEFDDFQDDDLTRLEEEKVLELTMNEALYLSDSMTLLLEHTPEHGKIHVPARQLMPQAGVPVPIELIQKIGLAVLVATASENEDKLAAMEVNVADLFLLRECCQSFIKINNERVGFNLLRKIYYLILERDIEERSFIEELTKGIDMSNLSIGKELSEETLREGKELDG